MAEAAEPVLASTLWSAYESASRLDDGYGSGSAIKRRRILTGCRSVDEAFRDGLTYGEGGICCISSDTGSSSGREVMSSQSCFT